MIYYLPKTAEINGVTYDINTDFRCILDIFEVLNDVELTNQERGFYALGFFYPDIDKMAASDYEEAVNYLYWFIRGGKDEDTNRKQRKLMDWEHDFPQIIAPVNRIIGHDIRGDDYVHWWTFLAAFMEIGECLFSQILHIRQLKADGKKLDKADSEWYRKNRELVDFEQKYSSKEEELLKLWGGE